MTETTSSIRAVIFDLGGVILRTDNPAPRLALAERLGLSRRQLEDAVFAHPLAQAAERGLATPEEAWLETARLLGRPAGEILELRREFFAGDVVDFTLVELIARLRPTYTTALLSNTSVVDLPTFLRDRLHIPEIFDVVISSAERRVAKPDPAIFYLALEAVGAQPAEAVFVDDSDKNIRAAEALGIHTVHFRGSEQARADLLALLALP